MPSKTDLLSGASTASSACSMALTSNAPSSNIAEHAAPNSEPTQHDPPDPAEPTTKRFLKIEDICL